MTSEDRQQTDLSIYFSCHFNFNIDNKTDLSIYFLQYSCLSLLCKRERVHAIDSRVCLDISHGWRSWQHIEGHTTPFFVWHCCPTLLVLLLVTFHDKTCFCLFKVVFLLNDVKPKRLSEGANMFHTLVFRFRTFFWLQFMWEKKLSSEFFDSCTYEQTWIKPEKKEGEYWKQFHFFVHSFTVPNINLD